MKSDRKVSLLGADYEHTLSIGGTFNGVEITYTTATPGAMFAKALNHEPFEFLEFSLSNYMMLRSRGADWLAALPIFPYRSFRHGILLVQKGSGINHPSALRGKKVGVPDYSMTASVWTRGILDVEYGVSWRDIDWVSVPRQRFPKPDPVRLTLVQDDLEQLLARGEIDALLTPHLDDPSLAPQFRTLFPDAAAEERKYVAKTGIYPPNHVVVANLDVVKDFDTIAAPVFQAYVEGKQKALKRHLGATLMPWGDAYWQDMLATFGGDPLPFGLTELNRRAVAMLMGFLVEQQLIKTPLPLDVLFRPDLADLVDTTASPPA